MSVMRYKRARYVVSDVDGGISLSKSLNITYLEDQDKILENQCDIIKKLIKDLDRNKMHHGGLAKDAETRELYSMMSHLAPSTTHASGNSLLPSQVRLQQLRKERREIIIQRFRTYRALKQFFREWRMKLLRRCLVIVHHHRIATWQLQRYGKTFFRSVSRMVGLRLLQYAMDAHYWRRRMCRALCQWRKSRRIGAGGQLSSVNSRHLLLAKTWRSWTDTVLARADNRRCQTSAVATGARHISAKCLARALRTWCTAMRRRRPRHRNPVLASLGFRAVVLHRLILRWQRVCRQRQREHSARLVGAWNQLVKRFRHWRQRASQYGSGRLINRAARHHRRELLSLYLYQWFERVERVEATQRYSPEKQHRFFRRSLLLQGVRRWHTRVVTFRNNYVYCRRKVHSYMRHKYGYRLLRRLCQLVHHGRLTGNQIKKKGAPMHPIVAHHNHRVLRQSIMRWVQRCKIASIDRGMDKRAWKVRYRRQLRTACKIWKLYHAESDQVAIVHTYAANAADKRRQKQYLQAWCEFVAGRMQNASIGLSAYKRTAAITALRRWKSYLRISDDHHIVARYASRFCEQTLLVRYLRSMRLRCDEIRYDTALARDGGAYYRQRQLRTVLRLMRRKKHTLSTGVVFARNRNVALQRSALHVWWLRCGSSVPYKRRAKLILTVTDAHIEIFQSRFGTVMNFRNARLTMTLGAKHFMLVSKLLAVAQWRRRTVSKSATRRLLSRHCSTSLRRRYLLHLLNHAKLVKQCRVHMTTILEHVLHKWKYRHRMLLRKALAEKRGDKQALNTFWRMWCTRCVQSRRRKMRLRGNLLLSVGHFATYKLLRAFSRLRIVSREQRQSRTRMIGLRDQIRLRIKKIVFAAMCNERAICSPHWDIAQRHWCRFQLKNACRSMQRMHQRREIDKARGTKSTSYFIRKRCESSTGQWIRFKVQCDNHKMRHNNAIAHFRHVQLRHSIASWVLHLQSTPSRATRRREQLQLCSAALQRMRELARGHRYRARISRKQLRVEQLNHVMTVWHHRLAAHQLRLRHLHRADLTHFRVMKTFAMCHWRKRIEVRLRDMRYLCWYLRKKLRRALTTWRFFCSGALSISYCKRSLQCARRHYRYVELQKGWRLFCMHTCTRRHNAIHHAISHYRRMAMRGSLMKWLANIDRKYKVYEHMQLILHASLSYKYKLGLRALYRQVHLANAYRGTQKLWLRAKFFRWTEKRRHVKLGQGFVKVGLQRMYNRYLELTAECFKIWKEETRVDVLIESHITQRRKVKLHAFVVVWLRDLRFHIKYRRALQVFAESWRRNWMASRLLTGFVLHHQKRGYARYYEHISHRKYVKTQLAKFVSRVGTQEVMRQRCAAASHHYCYVIYLTLLARLHCRVAEKAASLQRNQSKETSMLRYRCREALRQWRYVYLLRRSNRRMERIASKNHVCAQKRRTLHCITALQCRSWASGHSKRLQDLFSQRSKRIRGLRSFVKHFRRAMIARDDTVLQ